MRGPLILFAHELFVIYTIFVYYVSLRIVYNGPSEDEFNAGNAIYHFTVAW